MLTNISPTDTQLVTGLGTAKASQIRHEWLIDTLMSVKVNAQLEGADATFHTLTNPSRLANYTQIFKQGYKVSDTERAVDTAAFNDRYNYEIAKALKAIKQDMELALMRGSMATGTGTDARYLRGIKNALSLVTSQSGISLTETILNDYFQNVWNQGTEVDAVYGDMYLKRKISGFTGGATKNVSVEDKRLIAVVDVYEADAAKLVKLFAHRYVTLAASTNHDLVGINEGMFKIAYLRKPTTQEIPTAGDWTGGNIVAELTLQEAHYNAGFHAQSHL